MVLNILKLLRLNGRRVANHRDTENTEEESYGY